MSVSSKESRVKAFVSLLGLATMTVCAAGAAEVPSYPAPIIPAASSDDAGFRAIFDGKSLRGWDGDSRYWRVEDRAVIGETTEGNVPEHGSFLIWRGGEPADFELKLEYRISDMGNSGVQYRSTTVPGVEGALRGYQADIDGAGWGRHFFDVFARSRGLDIRRVTGQVYDEWGRTFLALPGQFSYVPDGEKQRVIASLGDAEALVEQAINEEDWNALHVIARDNVLIHIVNGRVVAMVIDDDVANRREQGLLALQLHGGDVMQVAFRDIRLKIL